MIEKVGREARWVGGVLYRQGLKNTHIHTTTHYPPVEARGKSGSIDRRGKGCRVIRTGIGKIGRKTCYPHISYPAHIHQPHSGNRERENRIHFPSSLDRAHQIRQKQGSFSTTKYSFESRFFLFLLRKSIVKIFTH